MSSNNNIVITDDKCIIHVNKRWVWREIIGIILVGAIAIVLYGTMLVYNKNLRSLDFFDKFILFIFYAGFVYILFGSIVYLIKKWFSHNPNPIILTESGVTLPNGNFYKWEDVTALRIEQEYGAPWRCKLIIKTYDYPTIKYKNKYKNKNNDYQSETEEDIEYWYLYASPKRIRKLFEKYAGKDLYEFKKFKLF